VNATAPKETAHARGELAIARIGKSWKGRGVTAAVTAASEIGQLIAGNFVGFERAKSAVQSGFNVRLIDEKHWPTVYEAFQSGRSSMVTNADLQERHFSAAANDNTKDDTINAETLLGMDFAPLEYVIPGFVVEGLA
jgi:hypothetical protein